MAKHDLVMRVRITGVHETLDAFRKLPKEANAELRERSLRLAGVLAEAAKANARVDESPQAQSLIPTVKARRDRVPVIVAGGARRVGRRRRPAWALLFGAEFGSNRFKQFGKRHQGRYGTWLFRAADENEALIDREWNAAADALARKWSSGGGAGG